ncbi:MAG TPA: gliding motility-associated C-terminal domain-containing protein [Chitinophagaceae bacterium]|nr:gliding motility-associated C-terminal domain-containing protein [Chitinophagaceae bacterium]
MKIYIITFLFIFSPFFLFAQKAGNIWYFGINAGLDFNTTPPSVLSNGQIVTTEGCSSIADPSTGSLLFYTDGITVWDKNHSPMPACVATPLNGDPSSTQSGVVVPKPGSSTLYYVFTTPAEVGAWSGNPPTMCYSVVDISLNAGNGDLISINTPILDSSTEKIAVVGNCNGSEYWIVGHRWNSDTFYAFKLTANGLSAPVKSAVGSVHKSQTGGTTYESIGYMKFSSDGKMIGLVNYMDQNLIELFNFNFSTGEITSCFYTETIQFPTGSGDGPYGCSFSPDNTKFYMSIFSQNGNSKVVQYDVTNATQAAVAASKIDIKTSASDTYAALQNGTDGKMYISNFGKTTLDIILDPNLTGLACNYQANAINIAPGQATAGLPVIVESFLSGGSPDLFNLPNQDKICKGDTILAIQSIKNHFEIYPSNTIWVAPDSSLVKFFPTTTTTYTIVNTGDCATNDTTFYTIKIIPLPTPDFEFVPNEPTLRDNIIKLENHTTGGDHYEWYQGNTLLGTSIDLNINNPGKGSHCYTLFAYNELNCSNSIIKCVKVIDTLKSSVFIPNAFSPNGDGQNDVFRIKAKNIDFLYLYIYNRFGQLLFQSDDINTGWNGDYKGIPCEIGTYFYLLLYNDIDGKSKKESGDLELLR